MSRMEVPGAFAVLVSAAAGAVVSGYPAIDNKLWLRCSAVFSRLPEIAKVFRMKAVKD